MITATLHLKDEEYLREEAKRRRISVEDLLNEWLDDRLRQEWHQRILKESERYQAMHAQLRAQYPDRYIAMYNGEVVDIGDEVGEVYQRIQARFGRVPVLITRVGVEPVETFTIRSPRLVAPNKPLSDDSSKAS